MQHYPRPLVRTPRTAALLAGLGAAADPYAQAALIPTLGMYALPYATTWPELSRQLAQIYQDKAADIPWLPSNWLGSVMSLHGKNGQILVPAVANVSAAGGIPWIKSSEQREWWDEFHDLANGAVVKYAANQAAQGKVELDRLYANAEFWNTGFGATMIDIQQNAYAVADGVKSFAKSPGTYLAIGAVVLGGLFFLSKR